jgi:hypothetical protein
MTIFFKQLDSLVDRWLSFKMNAAVDERYFIEKHIRRADMLSAKQFNLGYWLASRIHIYNLYLLGDFQKAASKFDESVKNSILEELKPEIKVKPSKSKKKQIEKEPIFTPPPIIKISDYLTDKEISDIKKDALKSIKDFIVINEAARKAKIQYYDDDNKWIEYRRKLINNNDAKNVERLVLLSNSDDALNNKIQSNGKSTSGETKNTKCTSFSDKLDLNIAIEHFKVLTTRVSKLNNEPFLTEEQFHTFIDVAFRSGKRKKKIRFNKKPKGEKQLIVKLFYEFYSSTYEELFGFQKVRDKYIKLLSDNFLGFEFDSLKNNFNKNTKGSLSDCEKYIKK